MQKQVRFHTMYELGRGRLREAWQELRQNQFRWKHRRGQAAAALQICASVKRSTAPPTN